MIKELIEEIKFIVEHPIFSIFVIGTFTGILPSALCALILKIF